MHRGAIAKSIEECQNNEMHSLHTTPLRYIKAGMLKASLDNLKPSVSWL